MEAASKYLKQCNYYPVVLMGEKSGWGAGYFCQGVSENVWPNP